MTREITIQDKFHCRKGLYVDGDTIITGNLSVNGSAVGLGGGGGGSGPGIDTGIRALSANWNVAYTAVTTNSGQWATQTNVTNLTTSAVDWNSTFTSVSANSANWSDTFTVVSTNSTFWDPSYSSIASLNEIGDVNFNYTSIAEGDILTYDTNTSSWVLTAIPVSETSTVSGDNAFTALTATSAVWNNTASAVSANSGYWDSAFTALTATSAAWNNTASAVSANSGYWDSAFTTVSANSATWTDRIDNGTVGLTAHDPAIGSDYLHFTGHILPSAHEQYDIGAADKKIRHLFLSDNSLTIGDTKAQEAFFTSLSGLSALAGQEKQVVTTPTTTTPGASAVNQILAVTELPAIQQEGVLYIVIE